MVHCSIWHTSNGNIHQELKWTLRWTKDLLCQLSVRQMLPLCHNLMCFPDPRHSFRWGNQLGLYSKESIPGREGIWRICILGRPSSSIWNIKVGFCAWLKGVRAISHLLDLEVVKINILLTVWASHANRMRVATYNVLLSMNLPRWGSVHVHICANERSHSTLAGFPQGTRGDWAIIGIGILEKGFPIGWSNLGCCGCSSSKIILNISCWSLGHCTGAV